MPSLPRARWYDNPILWLGAQLAVFLVAAAAVDLLLPSSASRWIELTIDVALIAVITIVGTAVLRRLRART